eukprot:2026429-Rhodomonas_salina.2
MLRKGGGGGGRGGKDATRTEGTDSNERKAAGNRGTVDGVMEEEEREGKEHQPPPVQPRPAQVNKKGGGGERAQGRARAKE